MRAGDLLSAALVWIGTSVLTLGVEQFAMVNLALIRVWVTVAVAIGRENKRLTASPAIRGQVSG